MAMVISHRIFSYAKKKAVDGGDEVWVAYAMLELSESSIHGPSVRWQLDGTDDWTRPHGEWKQRTIASSSVAGHVGGTVQHLWLKFNARWPTRQDLKVCSLTSADQGSTFDGFDQGGEEIQLELHDGPI